MCVSMSFYNKGTTRQSTMCVCGVCVFVCGVCVCFKASPVKSSDFSTMNSSYSPLDRTYCLATVLKVL